MYVMCGESSILLNSNLVVFVVGGGWVSVWHTATSQGHKYRRRGHEKKNITLTHMYEICSGLVCVFVCVDIRLVRLVRWVICRMLCVCFGFSPASIPRL